MCFIAPAQSGAFLPPCVIGKLIIPRAVVGDEKVFLIAGPKSERLMPLLPCMSLSIFADYKTKPMT